MIKTTKNVVLASVGFSLGASVLNSVGSTSGLKALNTGAKFLPAYATLGFLKETGDILKTKKGEIKW